MRTKAKYDRCNEKINVTLTPIIYKIIEFKNFKRCHINVAAYKQIGNSVAILVVQAVIKETKNQELI